jgi:single-strand DNA-binding protein
MNIVLLRGVLSRAAERRTLPSGDSLLTFDVAVHSPEGTHTAPVVWPGAPPATTFEAGAEVVVAGTVRRRWFRTGGGTASRTEVIAEQVVPARQRRKAEALVAATVARASQG